VLFAEALALGLTEEESIEYHTGYISDMPHYAHCKRHGTMAGLEVLTL
jgi:hypothetical protein